MNITPKTITVTRDSLVYKFNKVNDTHITNDNPIAKRLVVILNESNPPYQLIITGSAYDSLGQWTDETLKQAIVDKMGFETV
jgi:hypothetical protein